jgi:hypothetical protein
LSFRLAKIRLMKKLRSMKDATHKKIESITMFQTLHMEVSEGLKYSIPVLWFNWSIWVLN